MLKYQTYGGLQHKPLGGNSACMTNMSDDKPANKGLKVARKNLALGYRCPKALHS